MIKKLCLFISAIIISVSIYAQDASIEFSTSPTLGGNVFPSGLHYFNANQVFTIYASPAANYHFVRWQSTGSVEFLTCLNDPNGMIKTHFGNSTIVAVFANDSEQVTMTLAVSPTSGGATVPAAGTHQIEKGRSQRIVATAASGYNFKSWRVSGKAKVGNPKEASTYVVCSGNATVTARFTQTPTVKLTMALEPDNSGTTTPVAGQYDVAKSVPHEVVAQANSGYHFDHWQGSGKITIDNPDSPNTTVTLKGNATLTAAFKQKQEQATVAMSVSPDNTGYTSPAVGDITVTVGESISIHAYANSGYKFVRWKATGPVQLGDHKDSDTTMKVVNASSDNKTVTAIFEASSSKGILTIAADPVMGSTNPGVGEHDVELEKPYEVTAIPAAGHHFVRWEITGNGSISNTDLVTTWATLTGNATLTANYAADATDITLTVAASPVNGGSVNPGVGEHSVQSGQPVTLKAYPAKGYHFVNWSLTGDAWLSNTDLIQTTVTAFRNTTVTANFAADTSPVNLAISVSPTAGGSTNPGSGTYQYNIGQTVSVSARPASGYYFAGWVGSGSITILEPELTETPVLIGGNGSLTAIFEESTSKVSVSLAVSPDNSGTTNPGVGTYSVNKDKTTQIKARPKTGYYFKRWVATGNIRIAAANQTETVITPSGAGTVTAEFERATAYVELTVDTSPGNAGWTCPSGRVTVNANQYYKLRATPRFGYHFVKWRTSGKITLTGKRLSTVYAKLTGAGAATAVFAANASPAIIDFVVSPDNSGYTIPCTGPHIYYTGQTKTIYAIPKRGYHFVRWRVFGAAFVLEPRLVRSYVMVFGSAIVTATFAPNTETVKLTLAASPDDGGTTYPQTGTHSINKYQPYLIKARPASGYYFYRWTTTGKAKIADRKLLETSVTLSGDATVTAQFKAVAETVSLTMAVSPVAGGGTTPDQGTHSVTAGKTYQIEAIPAIGYYFVKWIASGPAILSDRKLNRTTVVLRDDATVTAMFASSTTPVTLTMAVSPDNSGLTNPGQGSYTVNAGETLFIEAEPLDGYHFVKWVATGRAAIAEIELIKTSVTLNGDATITATFAVNAEAIDITLSSQPEAGGTTNPGSGTYSFFAGQTIDVTAAAADGYHFVSWSGKGKVNILNPELSKSYVLLSGAGSIIANFAKNTTEVNLSIASLPLTGGSTNPGSGLHRVNAYEPIAVEAVPADGYYFKHWLSSGDVTIAGSSTTKAVATLTGDGVVIAIFEVAVNTATLTVSSEPAAGGVTSPVGAMTVNTNQYYEIDAIPNVGYHFVNWTTSGDISISNKNLKQTYVLLTGDGAVVANFAQNTQPATITFAVTPENTGYTDPGAGEHTYNVGQTIEIQAIPIDGYHFIEWEISGEATVGSFDLFKTVLEVNGNATVTAKFGKNTTEATITMAVNGEGQTVPARGAYTVYVGETRRVLAVPSSNYHFVNWTVTGNVRILNPSLIASYVVVYGDATITANFAPNTTEVDLMMAVSPANAGTTTPVVGTKAVNRLQPYSIVASPATNYYFSHWDTKGQGIVSDIKLLETTIVLYGDATVTAVFKSVTEQATLTMQLSPENGGTTTPAIGAHTVNINQTLELEATAADGFHFVSWQAAGAAKIGNINLYKTTVVLGADATVTALFATNTVPVTLTMASSPSDGGFTNPGAGSYTVNAGETLLIEAVPANGYHFVQWTLVGNGRIANEKSFKTTAVIERDSTIIAHFSENKGSATVNVNTLPASGGGTTPGSGSYEVTVGNVYKVEAVPAEGFYFLRWETTGNMIIESPQSPDTSVVALGNSVLTAEFTRNEGNATLTMGVAPANSGIINPAAGEHSIPKNQPVEVEAKAVSGYYFVQWLAVGDAVVENPDSSKTFVMLSGNASVAAEFAEMTAEATVTVAVSPDNAGSTSPAIGSHQIKIHDSMTVTATPATGFKFLKWTTSGNISMDDPLSVSAIATVNGNGQITAEFIEEGGSVILSLVVDDDEGGIVIPWEPTFVKKGEPFQIDEVPFDGFVFVDWTVNSGDAFITYSEETGTTVTCQSNATLTAKFVPVVKPLKTHLTVYYKRKNYVDTEEKPRDTVTLRHAGLVLEALDPDNDTVKVIAANQTFELNNDNGAFMETAHGYQYDSFDKDVRLIINFNKETWTFIVKKDLLKDPDFSNGIEAVLIVNDDYSGANYQVRQNSKWKFIEKQNGAGDELTQTGVSSFDITKANGSYVSNRKRPLNINITKAVIDLDDGYTFDPDKDSVLIYIDNVFFPIVPGSFIMKKEGVYTYNDRNRNSKMKLDFNKGTWSLTLKHNSSFKEISYKDGLDIYIVIGSAEAGIRLKINFNNKFRF